MRSLLMACAVSFLAALLGSSGPCRADSLTGSGSSFIGPLMSKWAREYEKEKNVRIDYTRVGSGAGIRQFLEKETDFGCTDLPLSDEQLNKTGANGRVLHIPLVLGGVVPAYNLANVKEPLRLTGPVLADIFLGNIRKWNDPVLKELNPGADLPEQAITVLHRADGSGSTAIFTDYLGKVSKDWKKQVGSGTTVHWPVGEARKGNEDLARAIAQTPGALGYVELLYALQQKIPHARVKNREGNFVQASLEGVTAAAEGALTTIPDDLRFSLTNAPGKDAYPICGCTWALVYAHPSADRGKLLRDFLTWATHEGQESVTDLYYARLPQALVHKTDEQLKHLQTSK